MVVILSLFVLILRDEQVVSKFLDKAGFIHNVAADGHQALQVLAVGGYDLVLMDCQVSLLTFAAILFVVLLIM
jgi:CheY-like chemotaxis protein